MKKIAVIVAGGSGTRMKSLVPKQFVLLQGKPVLAHTLAAFEEAGIDSEPILVLPESQIQEWNGLCKKHGINIPHRVIKGGSSRFASVRNGLQAIASEKNALVAIHDGVRPLIEPAIIRTSFETAEAFGSAVAAVPLKDSIRQLQPQGSRHLDREQFQLIQTPQTFRLSEILEAFEQASQADHQEEKTFTDDASVFEAAGNAIHLIQGSYRNIKITTPEDLLVAEAFLGKI